MRIFDTHLHADARSFEDLRTLALFGTEAALSLAHDSLPFSAPPSLFDHFERLLTRDRRRLRAGGIHPYIALGIHPQGIPARDWEAAVRGLVEYLDRPGVAAVGEIGLERGSALEKQVLRAQLLLARDKGLPVILHTPNSEKRRRTEEIIELLRETRFPYDRAVIDHAGAETVPLILASGAVAGLSVHPSHLTPREAAALVRKFYPAPLFLSSDLAGAPANLYALPETDLFLRKAGVSAAMREEIFWGAPNAFFKIRG